MEQVLASVVAGVTLDLRSVDDFAKLHLLHSYNLPIGELAHRQQELPKRDVPFAVVGSAADIAVARPILLQSAKPWTITHFLSTNEKKNDGDNAGGGGGGGKEEDVLRCAAALNLTTTGGMTPADCFLLCEPLRYLRDKIDVIEAAGRGDDDDASVLNCLDVGCGAGRDTVWLASRRLRSLSSPSPTSSSSSSSSSSSTPSLPSPSPSKLPREWQVTALDSRYRCLARCGEFATSVSAETREAVSLVWARVRYDGAVTFPCHVKPSNRIATSSSPSSSSSSSSSSKSSFSLAEPATAPHGLDTAFFPRLPPGHCEHTWQSPRHQSSSTSSSSSSSSSSSASASPSSLFKDADNIGLERSPALLLQRKYRLVLVVHFLERAFLPTVLAAVAPGGFLLYSSFVQRGAYKHHQSDAKVLLVGELAALCIANGFDVVDDVIEELSGCDDRPINHVLARRIRVTE
jgi:hypothetical protein